MGLRLTGEARVQLAAGLKTYQAVHEHGHRGYATGQLLRSCLLDGTNEFVNAGMGDGRGADYFLSALAADLQQQGITYLLEVYRICSFLTRCAGEMSTDLVLLKAAAQEARNE
ncbi:hypothetical protein ACFV99_39500 [Streptomyces sp. NPDC059944]|uniref:hypothetical protein n=1 Tax=unclassified Streptomyces TaxID=2593676 RepID=UPI00363C502C